MPLRSFCCESNGMQPRESEPVSELRVGAETLEAERGRQNPRLVMCSVAVCSWFLFEGFFFSFSGSSPLSEANMNL